MLTDVVVIGGGLAGISAAVRLANSGAKVTLIEKRKFLGGRVYSTRDRRTGDMIDNGQHALMGCYHNTFDLLRLLGTYDDLYFQPSLSVPYRGRDGLRDHLRSYPLPAPLDLLAGLLSMRSLGLSDKAFAIHFGLQMKRKNAVRDGETVSELFQRLGQTRKLQQLMWEPIALSALNEETQSADASLLQTVLKQAFFAGRSDSRMALASVALQKLHGDHAIRFIEERGGQVLLDRRVEHLEHNKNKISAVICSSGQRIECGACISAAPNNNLRKLLNNSDLDETIPIHDLGASPILSTYLWYDQPISDENFCCLMDCTYEWIFHRTNFMRPEEHKSHCVCLLISAAHRFKGLSREDLVKAAIEDIQNVYPRSVSQVPTDSLVFWEPRATFSTTPDNVQKRPNARTVLDNLILAGDWTATALPATIEGAVVSGKTAADLLIS